ncbi:cation diffusion facilitator family transporter [Nakamurella endophytica]|uniref:Transporter n=1 Tax=Nakamurella endophytica TaxID=1748367 RepID=A0A917TCJ1_9ACTN|nr:cation diffusion facilitator family transporter [Nakamurella endophytica]GGM18525.1 transporter [Nakamurella endophytica]
MSTSGGSKAIFAALAANMGIAVTKFAAFLLSGSPSLLAESIHSVADSGNQGLLLVGGRRSRRQATATHPFGYGRERYLYAFIVAIVLFSIGGLFALYEGINKVRQPHTVEGWKWLPIVVLAVATALESYSFRTAVTESNRARGGLSWIKFVRSSKAPELPVVLLEDLGALLGLALAMIGVILTLLTGNGVYDALATVAIGALLVTIAVVLAVETKSLLLGESASDADTALIVSALTSTPSITRIVHMKTLHLGPDEILVAAKIGVNHDDSAQHVATTIDTAESRIRQALPAARMIYLEPDIYRQQA